MVASDDDNNHDQRKLWRLLYLTRIPSLTHRVGLIRKGFALSPYLGLGFITIRFSVHTLETAAE